MADLRLPDAMNTSKALLKAIRIPREIIVHHQMRALQVDALPRSIGGHEDLHVCVLGKRRLGVPSLLASHAAMDRDHGLRTPEQDVEAVGQVCQGVPVLGEDDELTAVSLRVEHRWVALHEE